MFTLRCWMLGQDSNLGFSAQNTACCPYTTPHRSVTNVNHTANVPLSNTLVAVSL